MYATIAYMGGRNEVARNEKGERTMSAYDNLAKQYPGRVEFYNPVPSGKRTEATGYIELTWWLNSDETAKQNEEARQAKSEAAYRSTLLAKKLDENPAKKIYIKTATGYGHMRAWITK